MLLAAVIPTRRLTIFFLTLLLVGGHTAGLQILAWGTMFAARVQTTASLGQAFVSTLDGSKPCRLCQVVQQLERAGEAPDALPDQTLKSLKKPHVNEPEVVIRYRLASQYAGSPAFFRRDGHRAARMQVPQAGTRATQVYRPCRMR